MTVLNFPSSPIARQTYTSADRVWTFNNNSWNGTTGAGATGAFADGCIISVEGCN